MNFKLVGPRIWPVGTVFNISTKKGRLLTIQPSKTTLTIKGSFEVKEM